LWFIKPAFFRAYSIFKFKSAGTYFINILQPDTKFFFFQPVVFIAAVAPDADQRFVIICQLITQPAFDFIIIRIRKILVAAYLAFVLLTPFLQDLIICIDHIVSRKMFLR